jgi:rhamnogalacturonyl hydrolase YesR
MVEKSVLILGMVLVAFGVSLRASASQAQLPAPRAVRRIMQRVADWQLEQPSEKPRSWIAGAWYAGLYAAAQTTGRYKYYRALQHIGDRNGWRLGKRPFHADDYTVGQMYLEMYMRDHKKKMLSPTKKQLDAFLRHKWPKSLKWRPGVAEQAWAWCDALFMAPPTLAYMTSATGNLKYLNAMSKDWWRVTDYLYDHKRHLYYRDSRFFDRRAANGKKVFWSRGNGWVMGGLVRVLSNMPRDYPTRDKFIALYKQMAAKVITLQSNDGTWHPSLLDPKDPDVKETSGTGLFVYALAWGINHHLLERERYLPHVLKGWRALVNAVNQAGRLGYVQQVAASPGSVTADSTAPYGSGGFLLAGSEIDKLTVLHGSGSTSVRVSNPLDQPRMNQTIELNWAKLAKRLPHARANHIVVVDAESGDFALSQAIDRNGDGRPDRLVFQSEFLAHQSKRFDLHALAGEPPPHANSRVYGRYVPERKDDVAWESDRIAYRTYGPALAEEGNRAGIDVWVKSVRYPIVNLWYRRGDYHTNHGEGLDAYAVGQSAGCGGIGVFAHGKYVLPPVYKTERRIANGPVRVEFELTYGPWQTPAGAVTMVSRISLDRGHNLNRIVDTFERQAGQGPVPVAMGLAVHGKASQVKQHGKPQWTTTVWEPLGHDGHGNDACAIVLPSSLAKASGTRLLKQNTTSAASAANTGQGSDISAQALMTAKAKPGHPVTYYAGAAWSKGLDFHTARAWNRYVSQRAAEIDHPLRVSWP